jgi:hypothetical protein
MRWQGGNGPDRPAVLYVAALWPFARAPFEALTNANLTNLFGQGLFGVALAGVAWMAAGSAISWPWLALIALLLALSFLSHFGTLIVGLAIVGAVVIVLAGLGRQHVRRMGVGVVRGTVGRHRGLVGRVLLERAIHRRLREDLCERQVP